MNPPWQLSSTITATTIFISIASIYMRIVYIIPHMLQLLYLKQNLTVKIYVIGAWYRVKSQFHICWVELKKAEMKIPILLAKKRSGLLNIELPHFCSSIYLSRVTSAADWRVPLSDEVQKKTLVCWGPGRQKRPPLIRAKCQKKIKGKALVFINYCGLTFIISITSTSTPKFLIASCSGKEQKRILPLHWNEGIRTGVQCYPWAFSHPNHH